MVVEQLPHLLQDRQLKIAVMGQMRAGKDTVAKLLMQQHKFIELKFSDGITDIIRQFYPDAWQLGKPRHYYQQIGQSLRELDRDVWVKHLGRRLDMLSPVNDVIVTDVRQQNEVEFLQEQGFILIKVVADEAVRLQRIAAEGDSFNEELMQHETELAVNGFYCDFLIDNSGSYEQLEQKVNSIWQEITGGAEWISR